MISFGPGAESSEVQILIRLKQTVNGKVTYTKLAEPKAYSASTMLDIRLDHIRGSRRRIHWGSGDRGPDQQRCPHFLQRKLCGDRGVREVHERKDHIKGSPGFTTSMMGSPRCTNVKPRAYSAAEKIKPLVGMMWNLQFWMKRNRPETSQTSWNGKNELIRPAVANIDQAMIVFCGDGSGQI